ncbi:DUF7092 domain-containing protein [Cupriavidus basilensis]
MQDSTQAPAAAAVAATYFDGCSSRAHAGLLSIEGGDAVLREADGSVAAPRAAGGVARFERVRRAPRLVTLLADGAFCEVTDHAGFACAAGGQWPPGGLVVRAQNSAGAWRRCPCWGLAAVLVAGYFVVLPWGAGAVARSVPAALEARIGEATLGSIDGGLLKPSAPPVAEQERIRAGFAALRRPPDPDHQYRILFAGAASSGPMRWPCRAAPSW